MLLTRLMNTSANFQRIIALGLLLLVSLTLFTAGWLAVENISSRQLALYEMRQRAGKLTKIANLKDSLWASREDSKLGEKEQLFHEAESLTIGRARFQSRIDAIAQSNNIVLASAGSIPDIDEQGIRLIGLRIDISGSYEAVNKTIVDIETSKPPLIVRELTVRLSAGEAGERPVELAAQIKIFAAFRQSGDIQMDETATKVKAP
jgi:Type II secretion system (T2SS), protein M subtype b